MKLLKKFILIITLIIALSSSVFCFTVNADANKTDLQIAYDATDLAITTQDASPEDDYYETDSYQAFIDSIDALGGLIGIQAVIDDPLAEQTDVDTLTANINSALNGLILHDTYYAVLSEFSQANSVDLTPYTTNSQADYNGELDRIENILNTPTAGEAAILELSDDIDAVSDLLVLRGDKTTMNALILQIETIYGTDGIDYTASSFNLFKTDYDNIDSLLLTDLGMTLQEIVDNIDVTENDISVTELRLNEVLADLETRGDISELQSAYDLASAKDLTLYTPDSIILFESELERIEMILNSDDTNQTEADEALIDINLSYDLLVLIADKSNLELLNQLLIEAYYENIELYTESSHDLFKITCDSFGSYLYVNSVIVDDNATEALVLQLETSIQSALDLLVPLADNSELLIVYLNLASVDISGFTTNSQTAYLEELDRIYEIIIGDELDDTAALQALTDLTDVSNLLVELADYTELQSLYDTKDIYREEDYSSSSYGIFNLTLEEAEAMLINYNATQEDIDKVIVSLQSAIDGLTQTIETIYVQENETIDLIDYITLGEATISDYLIVDSEVVSVDENGVLTGLKYGKTQVTVVLSNGVEEVLDISVLAGVTIPVYIMVFTMPIITLGFAALVIYTRKETWVKLLAKISKLFKKRNKS